MLKVCNNTIAIIIALMLYSEVFVISAAYCVDCTIMLSLLEGQRACFSAAGSIKGRRVQFYAMQVLILFALHCACSKLVKVNSLQRVTDRCE